MLVQVETCWFNKFRDGRAAIRFEQSEAGPCAFCKLDDRAVDIMVVHVDVILAHAKGQPTTKRFKFEGHGCRQLLYGSANPLQSEWAANPGGRGIYVNVPVPGGSRGVHVDGNDNTAGHYVHGTRCGQVL